MHSMMITTLSYMHFASTARPAHKWQSSLLGNNLVDLHTFAHVSRLVVLLVVACKLSATQHFAASACLCVP